MLPALDFLICDVCVFSVSSEVLVSNTVGDTCDVNTVSGSGSDSGSDPSDVLIDVLSKFPSGPVSRETIALIEKSVTTDVAAAAPAPADNGVESEDESKVEVDVHAEVLRMFDSTRAVLEAAVEERAKVTVREWLKRKASLESCIEVSLREHLELYEKAHAIRLLLEMREQQLKAKARDLAQSHRRSQASGFGSFFSRHQPDGQGDLDDSFDVRRRDDESEDFYSLLMEEEEPEAEAKYRGQRAELGSATGAGAGDGAGADSATGTSTGTGSVIGSGTDGTFSKKRRFAPHAESSSNATSTTSANNATSTTTTSTTTATTTATTVTSISTSASASSEAPPSDPLTNLLPL